MVTITYLQGKEKISYDKEAWYSHGRKNKFLCGITKDDMTLAAPTALHIRLIITS